MTIPGGLVYDYLGSSGLYPRRGVVRQASQNTHLPSNLGGTARKQERIVMHFETTYKLENFILDTQWKDVPEEVKQRM